MGQQVPTLKVAYLISVNRTAPVETAAEAVDLLLSYREKSLAAET